MKKLLLLLFIANIYCYLSSIHFFAEKEKVDTGVDSASGEDRADEKKSADAENKSADAEKAVADVTVAISNPDDEDFQVRGGMAFDYVRSSV